MLRNPAAPLAGCVLMAMVVSLASASRFVGWPLLATELDFLIMPGILANTEAFVGSLYYALAQTLHALSVLPATVSLLASLGVTPERQMVYFAALQALVVCIGVIGVFLALGGRTKPWLMLVAFLVFLASGRHFLYYFKIVSSTFVSGFVIATLAATLGRRYWLAAISAGVVGAIHPTYFLLTVGAVVLVHLVISGGAPNSYRERLRPLVPLGFVTVAIVAVWLRHVGAILQPSVDNDLWFSYMQARSDLTFPLRQGYAALLGMLAPLGLASLICWREGRTTGERRYHGIAALCVMGILFVVVQVLSSEVLRSATLTRLALSHRLQFSVDILVFAAIIWVVLVRYAQNGVLAWMAVMWYGIAQAFQPVLPAMGLSDRGTLFLAVLALQSIEDAARRGGWLRVVEMTAAWVAGMAGLAFFVRPGYMLMLIIALAAIELLVRSLWEKVEQVTDAVRPIGLAIVLVMASGLAVSAANWLSAAEDLRAFGAQERPVMPIARWQNRTEYQEFIRFVTTNVERDDEIFAVPYFLTQQYSTVPYRAIFLDWPESNYVLYIGGHLQNVLERLAAYGIDLNDRPAGCTLRSMFLAVSESSEYYRCQRRAFQRQAMTLDTPWRDRVEAIQRVAPRTRWVLIRSSLLCPGERPSATWKDLALIRLSEVIPRSGCRAS